MKVLPLDWYCSYEGSLQEQGEGTYPGMHFKYHVFISQFSHKSPLPKLEHWQIKVCLHQTYSFFFISTNLSEALFDSVVLIEDMPHWLTVHVVWWSSAAFVQACKSRSFCKNLRSLRDSEVTFQAGGGSPQLDHFPCSAGSVETSLLLAFVLFSSRRLIRTDV